MTSTEYVEACDALRARHTGPRRRDEDRLQTSIVEFLRLALPDHVTFAIPNAARRSVVEGAAMKRTGTVAGIPDLAIIAPLGQAHFLEVKTAKGKPSQAQREVHARFATLGIPFAVVRSINDVRTALAAWNIETREVA